MIRKLTYIIGIFLFIGLFPLAGSAQLTSNLSLFKIYRFLQYVSNDYVDTINLDKMVEEAIIGTLKNLDPHSVYISKDDVKAMNEPLEGNFEGIGIEFNILNDTLIVVNPIPGGPSERVGIVAGDRIINVDGKNIAGVGLKNSDVLKMLRGNKGTKVAVHVSRKGFPSILEFTITRDKIPIYSLDAAYMIEPRIGYIKLNRFALNTEAEFLEALEKLKKEKMRDLILDLRGNGGGFFNTSVALSDHFLSNGKLIVYTEGRNSPRTDYNATNTGAFLNGRLVILLDEGSASASEIVAGAVQDWDRGIIVGRRSFGKGLVQNQLPLPDGSMIRLTVARYHTPTGRVIQKPYGMGESESYYSDFNNRYQKGELFDEEKISFPDSLKYFTLQNKRLVYGGGGIMPDIFVPIDTSFYTNYYGRLVRRGVINQFVLSYIDENRDLLRNNFPTFEKFNNLFDVNNKMIEDLVKLGEKQGIDADSEALKTSEKEIRLQVKALMAQSLFSVNYYFQIINQNNAALQKAVDVLSNWKNYKHLVKE